MAFINQAVTVLQTLVIALGAGLAVWGVVNLMEGYGNDNPGAKSQGIKQLMAGGGVVLIGTTLIPLPSNEGEPKTVVIPDMDIDTFTSMVWENLNADNKVSLFTRYIDIATGKYESRIINKNK